MSVTELDERRHPVEHTDTHWSDSLYFNGFDLDSGACFLTRMAVLPNQPSANALWLAWISGEPSYGYYRERDQLPEADWDATTIDGLGYRMLEPLRRWALRLDDGDDRGYVEFDGVSGCFDYADNPQPLPDPVARGHYEQSGTVRGELSLAGRRIEFDGVGQRDHSWGFRQWDRVREWHWVTGLFPGSSGLARSFNLFHVVDDQGAVTANGYVFDDDRVHAVVEAERRTTEGDGRRPDSVELVLSTAGGTRFRFGGERSAGALALQPERTVVQEAPMRWRSEGVDGMGIYELLSNP